jgi:plastocyanin
MGQRLHIQNPSGGSGNMLPSASYGNPGTYQYSSGSTTGTIKLQNPPDVGISFQNVQYSFSGSQMSVSGNIVNSNNFPVKNLYVYWHVVDNSGNYLSSWQRFGNDGQAYSGQIPAQSSGSFSETLCCLPNSGAAKAVPYLVQGFKEDGTKLISTSSAPTKPVDGPFVLPCSMQEKGDGVSTSSCNGIYESGKAKAKVGINYHSGLLPIKNYEALGYFIDKNGNQGQNIKATLDQINPKESKELVFVNPTSGFVSEFKMQMLGGILVTESAPIPQPTPNIPSSVTVQMAKGAATNTNCKDQCFVPSTAQVATGGTVTWVNVDSAAHTATALDSSFDTSLVMAGSKFSQKFYAPGTYPYMCILHPWSKGTIVVGGEPTQQESTPQPTSESKSIEFQTNTPTGGYAQVDKTKYSAGDIVTISGKGFAKSNTITISIRDQNQKELTELILSITKSGTFTTLWAIPNDLPSGTYVIQVNQPSNENTPQSSTDYAGNIPKNIPQSDMEAKKQAKFKELESKWGIPIKTELDATYPDALPIELGSKLDYEKISRDSKQKALTGKVVQVQAIDSQLDKIRIIQIHIIQSTFNKQTDYLEQSKPKISLNPDGTDKPEVIMINKKIEEIGSYVTPIIKIQSLLYKGASYETAKNNIGFDLDKMSYTNPVPKPSAITPVQPKQSTSSSFETQACPDCSTNTKYQETVDKKQQTTQKKPIALSKDQSPKENVEKIKKEKEIEKQKAIEKAKQKAKERLEQAKAKQKSTK